MFESYLEETVSNSVKGNGLSELQNVKYVRKGLQIFWIAPKLLSKCHMGQHSGH
jgi:hypothetical protein